MNLKKITAIIACLYVTSSLFATPIVSAQSSAKSPTAIVEWMYDNWLTKFDNTQDFGWDRSVTRWEISKFFTQFAVLIGKEKVKTTAECQFNDIDGYDFTLVPTIILACEYGLVKWFNWNYYPDKNLTKAEALTVIIRAVLWPQDESKEPRWTQYHEAWVWLWILQDGESIRDLDTIASRWTVGSWLYTASFVDYDEVKRQWSKKLLEILTEAFWEWNWSDIFDA